VRPPEIPPLVWDYLQPLDNVASMLELGNKRARGQRPYKIAFQRLGIRHVSVDLNGLDGALKLDLRRPLNLGMFDVVTNFGTSEHVSDQPAVWRNMVEAVKLDGVLVSHTPHAGWENHGMFYPTIRFYLALAELNGFVFERGPTISHQQSGTLCWVRMRRIMERPFTMPDPALIRQVSRRDRYTAAVG
jgi:SAM-dependent methyltransferase